MARSFYKVNIEITNVCNLQCSFCPEVERSNGYMTPDLFEKVIEQVSQVTKLVTFHLMGEPLLHPCLPQFVEICERYGVKIFLVTNGVLLNEKLSNTLLHPAFRQINFSLHSFQDNFPEKDPSSYLEKIFTFTERVAKERPTLFINYRLWNLQSPVGMGQQNIDVLGRIEDRFGVSLDVIPDTREQKSYPLKPRLSLHFDTEFTWPHPSHPSLGDTGTCYGLSSHFGVLVDGTVVPCCLDKEGRIPLGNLTTSPLLEILKGPRALSLLKGFQIEKLVDPLCQRCQYRQRFDGATSTSSD